MPALGQALVRPAAQVSGRVRVPGDKSISHRYAMLAALAEGRSFIRHYAPGGDCASTARCLQGLGTGLTLDRANLTVEVHGLGLRGFRRPSATLDAGNSGTTLRLMSGVLAAHPFTCTMTGDESLRRRPMKRVIEPLTTMGARFEADAFRAPLTITGTRLTPIDYAPAVPSAQVKSAVLLAGLQTEGVTTVREAVSTRDHTERALRAFGAHLETRADGVLAITGLQPLSAFDATVPGDVSSCTFWAVAAAGLPGSEVEIDDVGLNPSRTALFDVLRRAGAIVETEITSTEHEEPRGRVRIRHGSLTSLVLSPEEVPGIIDELPALAALATFGGELHVTGAGELRVKESDRISALAAGLRAMGGEIEEFADGFHVTGRRRLTGGMPDAAGDHRLAMAFAIAGLGAERETTIAGADAVAVSYPGFFETLESLRK